MDWKAREGDPDSAAVEVVTPRQPLTDPDAHFSEGPIDAVLLIPPTIPGAAALVERAEAHLLIRGKPHAALDEVFDSANTSGIGPVAGTVPDSDFYEFVAGLRALVWAIAILVMAVGFLAFVLSAVDRALGRRTEAVALQLVGVPAQTLRRGQLLEAWAPLGIGTALAVGLGFLQVVPTWPSGGSSSVRRCALRCCLRWLPSWARPWCRW